MSKVCLTVLAVATAALLSGCVQMHSNIVIDKDGSGHADLTLSASPTVIQALKEMQELSPDTSGEMNVSVFDDIDQDALVKAGKDHGVKVQKFNKQTAGERQLLELALTFTDLKGLSYVMGKVMGDGPGEGMGIFDAGDGNLVLRSTTYDFPADADAKEPAAEADVELEPNGLTPEKMQRQMEIMGQLMGSLSELDVSMKITVPGDEVASNAPSVEGHTSIWTINSSNMMSQESDLEPEITFSGKGLKIKPQTE